MKKYRWSDITRENVIEAIRVFDSEYSKYPEAKCTFLLYNNKIYPAKHIRGMAYKEAFGQEIKKSEFTGGAETVKFFEKLGFDITYTGKTDMQSQPQKNIKGQEIKAEANINLKVGLYLQTTDCHNDREFFRVMDIVKESDIDILVLPEFSYTPFTDEISQYDIFEDEDFNKVYDYCLGLSNKIGKAVIMGTEDRYGTIYTVYANASASEEETEYAPYIKHTMTDFSALDLEDYDDIFLNMFEPINYKGIKIGMTICYDCNLPMFSRLYGLKDVDVILNSTGGNIVYDKWYKYNKVRAIENSCYNFVTMGGQNKGEKTKSYVYGFNPEGGELKPYNLMKKTEKLNEAGTVYVYDIQNDNQKPSIDTSINQDKKPNKNYHIKLPVGNINEFLNKCVSIDKSLYLHKFDNQNIIICMLEEYDILKPEKVLQLLHNKNLKNISNKRYIIVNKFENLDKEFYETKLSVVLKVRAMENFCAVILESDIVNNCYQTGKNRTAQVLLPTSDGCYEIDLERTSGPESIWKNKVGMKASYRQNIEIIIDEMNKIATV